MLAPGVFRGIESNFERIFRIGLPPLLLQGERHFHVVTVTKHLSNIHSISKLIVGKYFVPTIAWEECEVKTYFGQMLCPNCCMRRPSPDFFWAHQNSYLGNALSQLLNEIWQMLCNSHNMKMPLSPRRRRGWGSNPKNSFRIGFYTPKNPWSQHSITISLIGESGTPHPSSKIESDLCPFRKFLEN